MFLQSLFLLFAVLLVRNLFGIELVRRLIARQPKSRPSTSGAGSALQVRARSSAAMVQKAAAFLPYRPTCLDRSLVLWRILSSRGINGELHIGVRPACPGRGIDAHAWIEHEGMVLNDSPDVKEHYASFPNAI